MANDQVLEALERALALDPRNGPLWLHLAELAESLGNEQKALAALRTAAELEDTRTAALRRLVPLLRRTGALAEALIRAEAELARHEDPELRAELARVLAERGSPAEPAPGPPPQALIAGHDSPGDGDPLGEDWAAQFDWGGLRIRFDDVAGLDELKRQIHLRILAPFKQPEIYRSFGRDAGGGLLFYGPPGCGKTFIARATAGELGARFLAVGIHDILDKYWGESEKAIHELFESARENSPTVLFFDEFDALGAARGGRSGSSFWQSLVNSLLQEMDGIRGGNRDVLVCAATNLPWNVDAAFRRPGRFDRVLFVPPPDEAARLAILASGLKRVPGSEHIDLAPIAARTPLFSGADLRGLTERATERAIERSLDSGTLSALEASDVTAALAETRSSIQEWIATARNYARYSNEGGQFDDLAAFLKAVKKW